MSVLAIVMAVVGASGVGQKVAHAQPKPTPTVASTGGLEVNVIGVDFSVGRNRFTFSLSRHGAAVTTAQPIVYFFALNGFNALPAGHSAARYEAVGTTGAARTGVYVAHTSFTSAGKWGVEIDVQQNGKRVALQAIFSVMKRSVTPAIGSSAPPSNNPTSAQTPLSALDSGHPPDGLHSVNIAASLRKHRSLVVLFASAAYCGTFGCPAEIAVIQQLARKYRHSVDFVHIDTFKNAKPPTPALTAAQWHIPSQPWVFVIDRTGRIRGKFEGATALAEIDVAIHSVIAPRLM